jgi:restriction endonuclease S subunit
MRDGWDVLPIRAIVEHTIGGVWGGELGSDEVEVTVVRSTEFTKQGFLNYETGVPRSIKSSQLKSRELRPGDILLEKSGGGPDQPVGRVVYVTEEIPRKFVCSNFVQLVRPNPEQVEPLFLFHTMWHWHAINRTLEFQAQTTGIRNLRTPDYLEQEIQLPSLPEQKRIVDLISTVDSYIEALQQQLESAKKSRDALLHELLTQAGDDWVETTLGGIAEYINGYPFKPEDLGMSGLPVIRIKQLLNPEEPVDRSEVDVPEKCLLRDGDIVFSWSGTLAVKVWNRGPAKLNQHLFRVVEKPGVHRGIVPLMIDHALEELADKSHGTTMKHITKQTLLPHKVMLPPVAEQESIVDLVGTVDSYSDAIQGQLANSAGLRSGLLSDLLSGKHEIPASYDQLIGAV